jgi:AraC-like DNA-binding protein
MTKVDKQKGLAISRENRSSPRLRQPRESRLLTFGQSYQRVGGLVVIPGLLREMSVDPTAVLMRAGLETSALDHVENRIPYVSMGGLFHECALATGCPHFGLVAAQRVSLSHLGIPGGLMRYSPTLAAGLQKLIAHQHLDNQGMAIFLLEDKGLASLGCGVFQKGAEFVDQIYDAFLAIVCNVMRELWGPRWAPEEVRFSRTKPADVAAYRRFFLAPCRFDREWTAIFFPTALLNKPMPEANPERLRILELQALAIGKGELLARLRRTLRVLLLGGRSSAQEVSALLLLHRRTLNRRLQDQGTNFQQVLNEIRFETACQLLDKTRLPLTDIAASLGYSESSAFTRAFKRWSGGTPSGRRRASAGGACPPDLGKTATSLSSLGLSDQRGLPIGQTS